jgi:Domain of unknown function (DUF4405)
MNKKWLSLCLDSAMLAAAIVLGAGLRPFPLGIHEWLGVLFVAGLLLHLLLQWSWIASATGQLRTPRTPRVRINYTLNALLFICMTFALASGFVISRAVLPVLGMHPSGNFVWTKVHKLFSTVVIVIVGLHLGMNWHWVKTFALGLPAKLRNVFSRSWTSLTPRSEVKTARRPGLVIASVTRRLTAILIVAAVVVIVLYSLVRLAGPAPMVKRPERNTVVVAGMTPARDARDSWYYPFEVLGKQTLIIAISAAAGRLVLRLRI